MKLVTMIAAISLASPAAAHQDIQPVFDLPALARGQVISATAKAQAARAARRRSGDVTRAECAIKARASATYGAEHPGVRNLYKACARAGM